MTKSKPKYQVHERTIHDYVPDAENANRGSRRGQRMIEKSYRDNGAGRSWLADADGQLIAGNHAREAALQAGIENVLEIEVEDPTLQIVVRRPDLDLDGDDPRARALAFADNRTGEVSLDWSPDEIAAHAELLRETELFRDDELEQLQQMGVIEEQVDQAVRDGQATHSNRDSLHGREAKISPVLYMGDLAVFEDAIAMARRITGERRRGALVTYICQFFLDQHTDDDIRGLLDGDA